MVLSAGSGDKSIHIDADDNLQYNPADGILTVNRVDTDFLEVQNSVITNLIPFDSLGLSLGNATNPWQDLYLSNSTLYLGDATITANGNSIVVDSITINNGNVGTIGNIASINLTGSNSNVLYGNGVFAAITGGGGNGTPGGSNTQIQFNDNGNFGANSGFTFDSTTGNIGIPGIIIGSNTIEIDNRATGNNADINLYSADDITLQARDRAIGSTAEGGDINIYAGDSAEDSDTSAGDIIIEAGRGGASNIDFGGSGGFVRVEAGQGGAASTGVSGESARSGGSLTLNAGDAGTNNGNIFRGSSGGDVTINAGDSTGNGEPGGDVTINAGLAGANALAGRVQINIPSSANGNGGTWTFDGNGNLTLPANTFAVNYANGTQVPLGGGGANTGNVTFDDVTVQGDNNELNLSAGPDYTANLAYLQVRAGDVASHIHFDTGNSEAYDLIIGNDQKFVQVSSTGNIIMSSYDGNTSYEMTLDTTGNLTIPGDIKSINTGFSFIANIANVDTTANSAVIVLENGVFGGPESGQVTISDVVGTTEANGTWYFEAVENDAFQLYYDEALQNPVDGTGWPAYVSGGLAVAAGYNNLSITGGNVTIINNNGDAWTFESGGNLVLPGSGYITNPPNSSLDPINPNLSTMVFTPDPGYSSQSLVLDPTLPGHIHLRAPGANIDEPVANIFLGGEESSFEVGYSANSSAPNVFIHSGGNTWTFDTAGRLLLPTIELDVGNTINEQTIIQSQRKLVAPFRYSAEIDGDTPTVIYTASDSIVTSMKVTVQIQHLSLGFEFFDVSATEFGGDTYYTVSNRLHPPGITDSTVEVDLNGSNEMEITVTINSGAETSWVTYDATEFGIAVD